MDALQRQDPYRPDIERATDGVTSPDWSTCAGPRLPVPGQSPRHRDGPAFVNYAVYQAGIRTPRIAIGDNPLQRPFVSDPMRA